MQKKTENIPFISIVIPTYNSSKFIKKTLTEIFKELRKQKYKFEIIVVNDFSKDDTTIQIQNYSIENAIENIRIIENRQNYGQSIATINGIKVSKGSYVFLTDDDLQYEPCQMTNLIEKIIADENIKMICGYKINKTQTIKDLKSIFNKAALLLLRFYFNRYFSIHYFTPFKVFNKSFIKNDKFNIFYFWEFNIDGIQSVPVIHSNSIREKSNYNLSKLFSEYIFIVTKILSKSTGIILAISIVYAGFINLFTKRIEIYFFYASFALLIVYFIIIILLKFINNFMSNAKYTEL